MLFSIADVVQELNEAVYTALLKALLAPDVGNVSWRLVRQSAAGALTSLLQVLLCFAHTILVILVFRVEVLA